MIGELAPKNPVFAKAVIFTEYCFEQTISVRLLN